ncbi:MAG: hypothetical protein Ct9H90mP16_17640 [Candidatus Poseidoniales archaeon]|nr:MAG: hypothetical protein Ct9H90mP16_17640 [Candidatus Poseidoniales archaeon]
MRSLWCGTSTLQVTDCVNLVFASGIQFLNAMKQAKLIAVQNAVCILKAGDGGFPKSEDLLQRRLDDSLRIHARAEAVGIATHNEEIDDRKSSNPCAD